MFVRVGTMVPVKKLIEGIIVDSGNDSCVAMAQYIGGTEKSFVSMMNAEAKTLGMNDTHYIDSTGLPRKDHYSTAHDLTLLARAIILDFPQDYQWYKQKWLTYNNIRQPNRNRLLWRYSGADGLKTGHTKEAGYCLVASAKRNNMRLISVVMGTPTDLARADESIRLLNYGFRFFSSHLVYQAGSIIAKPRVWFAENKTEPVGVKHDFYITPPKGQYSKAKLNINIPNDVKGPIKKGQTIGQIVVTLHGKTIAIEPLIALEANPEGGIMAPFI